jgi:hypothetical protein
MVPSICYMLVAVTRNTTITDLEWELMPSNNENALRKLKGTSILKVFLALQFLISLSMFTFLSYFFPSLVRIMER